MPTEDFETIVNELMALFDVEEPPIPVELMLRRPPEGMWPEVDLAELSASFIDLSDRYAPRMSVVRLLARHVARCEWGQERGLDFVLESREAAYRFARAIIMPRNMLVPMLEEEQPTRVLSSHFEVPEEDVVQRAADLGYELL